MRTHEHQARRRLRRLRLHRPADLRVPARAQRAVRRRRPGQGPLQDVVGQIPGIETADHDIVEVEHTRRGADRAVRRRQVVCNTVGPFIKYGPEVVEACLAAGAPLPRHHRRAGLGARRPGALRRRRSPRRGCCSRPASRRCTRPARSRRTSRSRRRAWTPSTSSCSGRASRPTPRPRRSSRSSRPTGSTWQQNQYVKWDPPATLRRRRARPARARRWPCRGAAPATRCGSRTTRGWPTSRSPAG